MGWHSFLAGDVASHYRASEAFASLPRRNTGDQQIAGNPQMDHFGKLSGGASASKILGK